MKKALAAIVVVAGMASVASAGTISHTVPFGPTNVPFSGLVLNVPQYNGINPLISVTLELSADTSAGSIAWDNEAGVTTNITLGVGAEVTASAPAALTLVAVPLQTDSATGIAADNDGAADFIGTDSFSVTGGSGNDTDSDSPGSFVAYIGAGTFAVTIDSVVETFVSTTGGFGPIDVTPGVTEGFVKVIYEYSAAIPSPAAAGAGLSMLGGLGLLARRRRRH